MRAFHRRHYKWLRHVPRRKHLRGGWLHRLLGAALFAPELWKPAQRPIAGGLALGLFIGCTPTMGAQIILAAAAAYFLRVNIAIAIAATFISNPITAPVVYTLEYRLGVWLTGVPNPKDVEEYTGMLRSFARYAKPLWIGSIFAGGTLAAISYTLVTLLWRFFAHTSPALPERDRT